MTDLKQDARGMTLLDVTHVIFDNARLLALVPAGAALAVLALSFFVPSTYTATTRILLTSGAKNPDQYVVLFKSRGVFDAISERFDLKEVYGVPYLDDARKELEQRTHLSLGAGIITIGIEDQDAQRAAAMANAFLEEFRKLYKKLSISVAAQRVRFFELQVKHTKDKLATSEMALQSSEPTDAMSKTLPYSALELLARLQAEVTAHELKLAALRLSMTDSDPEIKLAVEQLAALRSELTKTQHKSTLNQMRSAAQHMGAYRDAKYYAALLTVMAKEYELARLAEVHEEATIKVVDSAQPPLRPSKPRWSMIVAIASGAAFFATLLFVLFRETLRSMVVERDAAELQSQQNTSGEAPK